MAKRKNSRKINHTITDYQHKALERYLAGGRDPAAVNAAMKVMGIK